MRTIIVSNRLPVSVKKNENDFEIVPSIGGLATGLKSFLANNDLIQMGEYLWFGSPGECLNTGEEQAILRAKLKKLDCYPIFTEEQVMNKFYSGFCNNTLWPLFHHFLSKYTYDEDLWLNYKNVNEIFFKELAKVIQPGDVIWIHDYHLLLLPKLIQDHFPDVKVGFFLHIPFPSLEIFQLFPKKCRQELLAGLLGADLVGFHIQEYVYNFLYNVREFLGFSHGADKITTPKKKIKVRAYPMGIDFSYQHSAQLDESSLIEKQRILQRTKDLKIILSIDRLDYTKGIPNRLYAFDKFLETHPQWRGKVQFLLFVAPCREKVIHYQMLKKQIDELVGSINGKYADVDWTPIIYQYKAYSIDYLRMLYKISDVALVTPLRDGMNLIAKEYVASKNDKNGVLILSETAGAAKELLESITINANCIDEMSEALNEALEMDSLEKRERMSRMQTRLKQYDVVRWGNEFIQDLLSTSELQKKPMFYSNMFR